MQPCGRVVREQEVTVIDQRTGAAGFDAFYAASSPRVVRALHAMTGNLSEAQDAAQEGFARAWQRWDKLQDYDAPEAWVRTVAWRVAVSRARRAKVGLAKLRRHGPPPDVPGIEPDHVALVAALRQISADQRRAVVLHHVIGLSVAEIAAECDVPDGTVKARLSRGRTALAALLSEQESSHA